MMFILVSNKNFHMQLKNFILLSLNNIYWKIILIYSLVRVKVSS